MSTPTTPAAPDLFADLELKNDSDAAKIDYKNLPAQRGSYAPPPQPGRYLVGLPSVAVLKTKAVEQAGQPEKPVHYQEYLEGTKKRLRVKFRGGAALLNYGAVGHIGPIPTPLETQVANNEREVGKAKALTSDFANMLTALGSVPAEGEPAGNATDFKHLLIAAHEGRRMEIVTDLTANCNKEANAYVYDPAQDKNVDSGRKGCGRKYGTKYRAANKTWGEVIKLPFATEEYDSGEKDKDGNPVMASRTVEGVFATRFSCVCGAALNCFTNIVSFHPPTQG